MSRAKPNVSQEEAQSLSLPPGVGLPILLMPQIMGKAAKTKSTEADQKYRDAAAVKSPEMEESLYSPVEGGVLGIGGLIASALGVNTRDINAFGQAYAQSKQAVQERKYQNKKQKADEKRAQLETEGKIADREAARYKQASDELKEERRYRDSVARDERAFQVTQQTRADIAREATAGRARDDYDRVLSQIYSGNYTKEQLPGFIASLKRNAELGGVDFDAATVNIKNAITNGDFKKLRDITNDALSNVNFQWSRKADPTPEDRKNWANAITLRLRGALSKTSIDVESPEYKEYLEGVIASIPDGRTASAVQFELRQQQLLQLARMNDARQARWQNITVENQKWNRFMDTAKLNLDRQKFNLDAQKVMLGESSALNKELVKNYAKSIAEATQGIKGQEAYLEAIRNASDEKYAVMQKSNKSLEGMTRDQAMQALAGDIEYAKELLKNDQDSLDFVQNGGYGGVAGATGGSVGANNANEKPPKWLSKKQLGYWNKGYRPDNPDNPNTTWHGPGG